jgi:hypothetical protein
MAPTPAVASARSGSSSKGLLIFAILAFLMVGGAGASFVAWKAYKGESLFGGGGSAKAVASLEESHETSEARPGAGDITAASMPDSGGETGEMASGDTPRDGMTPEGGSMTPVSPGEKSSPAESTTDSNARASKQSPVQETRQSEATTPPPAPRLSGTLLAVSGDPSLVPYVSEIMANELSASGIQADDASALPDWDDLMRQDPQTGHLVDQVRKSGFATLILVRVDPTGQRQLNYMGRYETAYTARVTIQKYDVATDRAVGKRASTTVEYTQLNAEREAEKKVGPAAREFVNGL